jgi:hypothetical protein
VKDANNNAIGTLLGGPGFGASLSLKNGKYFFNVNLDGTFSIAQIWWTGPNCTGTPYLNDGNGGQIGTSGTVALLGYAFAPVYSGKTNSLYILSNSNSNSVSLSQNVPGGTQSIENPTCMSNGGATPTSGWPLTLISPATMGFSAAGNPLKVATPLQIP